jgi:hypothetical protein
LSAALFTRTTSKKVSSVRSASAGSLTAETHDHADGHLVAGPHPHARVEDEVVTDTVGNDDLLASRSVNL